MLSRLGHRPPLSPVWIAQASRSGTANRWPERKVAMLRRRYLVRPPVAGNAETLRMIAPGPDDRTDDLVGFRAKPIFGREIQVAFGRSGWSNRNVRNAFGRFGRSEPRTGSLRTNRPRQPRSRNGLRTVQVERAKRGWSSDRPDGAKPRKLRGPSGRRNRATRETWRRSSEQHGCSEPPKPDGAALSFGLRQADRSPATGESVARPAPQLRLGVW